MTDNTAPIPGLTPERVREITRELVEPITREDQLPVCCWPGCDMPTEDYAEDYALCIVHTMLAIQYGTEHGADDWLNPKSRTKERRARQKRGSDGWVYYARVGDAIKIGFTTDVKARIRQYPPGTVLLAVEPGSTTLERERHQEFDHSRTRGREWYRESLPIREHIEALRARYGDCSDMQPHFSRHRGADVEMTTSGSRGRVAR